MHGGLDQIFQKRMGRSVLGILISSNAAIAREQSRRVRENPPGFFIIMDG